MGDGNGVGGRYLEHVARVESPASDAVCRCDERTVRLMHAAMGMATEAGEFVDAIKRHVFYGTPIDETNLKEELGDMMWYIGLACIVLGLTPNEVMESNTKKLLARYPEKFDAERAVARDIGLERSAVEGNE